MKTTYVLVLLESEGAQRPPALAAAAEVEAVERQTHRQRLCYLAPLEDVGGESVEEDDAGPGGTAAVVDEQSVEGLLVGVAGGQVSLLQLRVLDDEVACVGGCLRTVSSL